ncbi:MAG: tyrosine-type recombinase/integrase [Planctomycetota bacterium JB042]
MRVEDALDRYVTQLRADGRSDHTIRQVERHVRALARWLEEEGREPEVGAIDHEILALFLVSDAARLRPDGRPKRATATNALRSSVRTFFGYVHSAGHVPANPARLVRRARCGTPPPRAFTDDERERLVAALDRAETWEDRRDRALFLTMLGTGIRLGSALGLDVADVDLDAGELAVRRTKGDRPGRAFLPAGTAEVLRGWIGRRPDGPVFPGRGGGRLSARHVQRRFAGWLARAGIRRPASPHSLRHDFATRLYRRTGDLPLVKEALGHRSIASTIVYARAGAERVRAAVGTADAC